MKKLIHGLIPALCLASIACKGPRPSERSENKTDSSMTASSYARDREFLQHHTGEVLELRSADGQSKVLLSPAYQGRVMTSTSGGDEGLSFGWINYKLIAAGEKKSQFNPVGGEERFWLGPEGGQYSLYFKQGDSFQIDHWQVPAVIDTLAYEVKDSSSQQAVFFKKASLQNYSGTSFDIEIERRISLLGKADLEKAVNASIPDDLRFVAYRTRNQIKNVGQNDWTPEKGLVSVWLLGMFTPSPETTVIIPFEPAKDSRQYITDNYFGSVPPERLKIKDSVLFFKCDGKFRSKIGLAPRIAKPLAASVDLLNNVLTLVIPTIDRQAPYVNSKWEIQKEPYKGDVINSYNDGPLANGDQLGPFYEIESSSPALALKKGATGSYAQITAHIQGTREQLRKLVQDLLHVDINLIKN